MPEHPRVRDMSDDELVSLIQGLPERKLSPSVRDGLFSHAVPARRQYRFRPAVALAALVVLLAADWVTLRVQGGAPLRMERPEPRPPSRAQW